MSPLPPKLGDRPIRVMAVIDGRSHGLPTPRSRGQACSRSDVANWSPFPTLGLKAPKSPMCVEPPSLESNNESLARPFSDATGACWGAPTQSSTSANHASLRAIRVFAEHGTPRPLPAKMVGSAKHKATKSRFWATAGVSPKIASG